MFRTGLSKVGMPGADIGLQAEDPTIAELLKPLGYATGQFGKNHLGDLNEFLPTVHGFDEFFGNLYHLNAEEEPERPTTRRRRTSRTSASASGRAASSTAGRPTRTTTPRSRATAASARQRIEDTGPLTKKRMETIDDEVLEHALDFIERQAADDTPFFVLVQHDAHALPHPPEAREPRPGRALAVALPRHDDRPRQAWSAPCSTSSTSSGIAENTIVDLQHRQRPAHEHAGPTAA